MGNCASYVNLLSPDRWKCRVQRRLTKGAASVVPYQGFKTADGDIFIGGANDRLFGILCDKLGKPEWKTDPKFISNNERVKNRTELEGLIEAETEKRTTKEWLEIFEGCGVPYAAVNDVQDTLNHEHSKYITYLPSQRASHNRSI